jgi:tetratricopeptide (TPR) repeat protein
MIVFLLFRFGWAKPVSVDASRFRMKNKAFGMFLVSIAGASANLLTALLVLAGMTVTVLVVWTVTGTQPIEIMQVLMPVDPGPDAQGVAAALSQYMMMVNLLLAVFNLLPLPPLDGFQAAISLYLAVRTLLGREPAVQRAGRMGPRVFSATEMSREPTPETDERRPAQIHFDIGLEYQKEGQWDEAIARYRQATAVDEHFALAYYNLGLAYWAKGRTDLAASSFRAAMGSASEPSIRLQADLRLRELAPAGREQDPATGAGEVDPERLPPPLEPGGPLPEEPSGPGPLAPGVARRVWLRLGIGTAGMLLLAAAAWLYVTAVALMSVM